MKDVNSRISQALTKLFDKHRIIFWYDVNKELRTDYEELQMSGIEKIELINNEYSVKYRILREQPKQKFLIYKEGERPKNIDNWLLDVLLANNEFRTDQVGMLLAELDLGFEFSEVVHGHTEFYQSNKRKDALKNLLKSHDTPKAILLKMLAVCAGSEARIDTVIEHLLQELSNDRDDKIKLIERCGLDTVLWEQLLKYYEYDSKEKSILDLAMRIFKDCYEIELDPDKYSKNRKDKGSPSRMSQAIQVFLKRWKDSRQFESGFETLSERCEGVLGIEQDLVKRDFRKLISLDYFQLVDKKIIEDLVKAVTLSTVSSGDVSLWVRQRRQSHWYQKYEHIYEAIDFASKFISSLNEAKLNMENLTNGVQLYSNFWYKLDHLYRKFVYHTRKAGQASLLNQLAEQVENLYSNNYLLKLNDNWQAYVDSTSKWIVPEIPSQQRFFKDSIEPFLRKNKKVCVIISDGLRYEIGHELVSLIHQENNRDKKSEFYAQIKPMLSTLPSYTQLGMAALLPNKELSIADNETSTVYVDGQSTQGIVNRSKILACACNERATAIKAEDVMILNKEDGRDLLRNNDVIYIYHNRIDSTGDKRESEERVFEAVEDTLQEIVRIVKKMIGLNVNNLLITSDHGFIYQNRPIDESDFAAVNAEGDTVLFKDRRFIFGKGLKEAANLRKFSPAALGLVGDVEVQIPKSINRLRLQGSGSRYVHGGASLQEVVIPVLSVHKRRSNDIVNVEVDILQGASSVITSGQLAVSLYQAEPVTDNVQQRTLCAGIYTQEGELISDSHNLTFDLSSDNPRERELQVRFVLTRKAEEVNGEEVILKLEEKVAGTAQYSEYKTLRYMMRRSITGGLDF